MKKSRLEDIRVYLSGPCENVKDSGASWRTEVTPRLLNLGMTVFDPVKKNGVKLDFIDNNGEEFNYVRKLRDNEEWDKLAECMKEVTHVDLRLCDCADILIVQLDANVCTTGTIDEIVTACNQKKPLYLCSKQGKKTIPLWLFGRVPLNYIFNDLDEIINKLTTIAFCDEKELSKHIDKRWLFSNELGV